MVRNRLRILRENKMTKENQKPKLRVILSQPFHELFLFEVTGSVQTTDESEEPDIFFEKKFAGTEESVRAYIHTITQADFPERRFHWEDQCYISEPRMNKLRCFSYDILNRHIDAIGFVE